MGAANIVKLQAVADSSAKALAVAQADAAALAKAQATPRVPDVVITDLLELIVMRLGNRKDMQLLLVELKTATEHAPAVTQPVA